MAVRDDRSDVKQTTTGFRGPLMVQSLTSAKSKFLSLSQPLASTMLENGNHSRKITGSRTILCALFIFIINLIGFYSYRSAISSQLFGGDINNLVNMEMSSYAFQVRHITDTSRFFKSLSSSSEERNKLSSHAFIYNNLSSSGKKALKALVRNPDNKRERANFIHEFNRSIIEAPLDWPSKFTMGIAVGAASGRGNTIEYNLRVIAAQFPNEIAIKNTEPLALSGIIRSIPQRFLMLLDRNQSSRYLPLTALYSETLKHFLRGQPDRVKAGIWLTAFVYATTIALTFMFSMRFLVSIPWALFSTFLFQSAMSSVLIPLQLFSLPYLLVPLVMVGAFLSYYQYKESSRIEFLVLFAILSFAGPWIREFSAAIPFIVFGVELLSFSSRRSRALIFTCIPLMIHSLFPTLFTAFLGLNSKGVHALIMNEKTQAQLSQITLNWDFGGFLFVQFAPVLWILAFTGMTLWLLGRDRISSHRSLSKVVLGGLFLLFVTFVYSFFFANSGVEHRMNLHYGPFLAFPFLLLALLFFRINTLLPLFFLATFLPFFSLRLADLHLAFALPPLAIMVTWWIRYAHQSICKFPVIIRPYLVAWVYVLFLVGVGDQASNIVAVSTTQTSLSRHNEMMGKWLKDNTARHSIGITNFLNFTDLFYYSGYHFDPYETVENCPMGPSRVVYNENVYTQLIENNESIRDVYLLEGTHPFFSWQKNYHSHKYVNRDKEKLKQIKSFRAEAISFYIDPFKNFIPRFFIQMPAYMDWGTDFYFNSYKPFRRITYADYHLYRYAP